MKTQTITRGDYHYTIRNLEEFDRIYSDIFDQQEYKSDPNNQQPYIIDCGAHVGIGLTYYHSLYPQAHITAFEPNPQTFQLLQQNMAQNNISAQCIQAALGQQDGQTAFYISADQDEPWSWGDSIVKNVWYDPQTTTTTSVKSLKLSSFITQPVDLLKIDVEGMETEVVNEIADKLTLVKEMYIEFHGSSTNPTNQLDRIVTILYQNGLQHTLKEFGQIVNREQISQDDPQWIIIHAFHHP